MSAPYTHRQHHNLIECSKSCIGEYCASHHRPEADHTDEAYDSTQGKEWWIPCSDTACAICKNQRNGDWPPDESDDTDNGVTDGREAVAPVFSIDSGGDNSIRTRCIAGKFISSTKRAFINVRNRTVTDFSTLPKDACY